MCDAEASQDVARLDVEDVWECQGGGGEGAEAEPQPKPEPKNSIDCICSTRICAIIISYVRTVLNFASRKNRRTKDNV